jgi:hypothetical protein
MRATRATAQATRPNDVSVGEGLGAGDVRGRVRPAGGIDHAGGDQRGQLAVVAGSGSICSVSPGTASVGHS